MSGALLPASCVSMIWKWSAVPPLGSPITLISGYASWNSSITCKVLAARSSLPHQPMRISAGPPVYTGSPSARAGTAVGSGTLVGPGALVGGTAVGAGGCVGAGVGAAAGAQAYSAKATI